MKLEDTSTYIEQEQTRSGASSDVRLPFSGEIPHVMPLFKAISINLYRQVQLFQRRQQRYPLPISGYWPVAGPSAASHLGTSEPGDAPESTSSGGSGLVVGDISLLLVDY